MNIARISPAASGFALPPNGNPGIVPPWLQNPSPVIPLPGPVVPEPVTPLPGPDD